MSAPERYGKVRLTKIIADFNALRTAIRAHDSFAAENAWERCERWVDIATTNNVARIAALEAEKAKAEALLREAAEVLQWIEDRRAEAVVRATAIIAAPEDEAVLALCRKHGFGAVMDSAARQWAAIDDTGAFFIGGCLGDTSASAMLSRIK